MEHRDTLLKKSFLCTIVKNKQFNFGGDTLINVKITLAFYGKNNMFTVIITHTYIFSTFVRCIFKIQNAFAVFVCGMT